MFQRNVYQIESSKSKTNTMMQNNKFQSIKGHLNLEVKKQ